MEVENIGLPPVAPDHLDIEQIKTLSFSEQLTILRKNCNRITYGQIARDIRFYENHHPIHIDQDKEDYYVMEDVETPDGKIEKKSVKVRQTKLALPYPQQIVANMVAFLYGNDIDLVLNGNRNDQNIQDAFAKFTDIWNKDLRMMSLIKKATRMCGIETRSAIQFMYDGVSLRGKVLSFKDGYKIYRHRDDANKIDAVTIEYKRDKIVDGVLRMNVPTTEIWTDLGVDRYEGVTFIEHIANPMQTKKLLFAYLEQDASEFEYVKDLISLQDYSRSMHSDVNVRIGNPALVVHGKLSKKPVYNATVKIYEIDGASGFDASKSGQADMKYLEVTSAPESIKLEMQNNENDIYRFTWPDLNKLMTDMKNGNLSTQSMKLTFLQAFVKVAEKREIHDEFISRIISIVKDMATELYPELTGMKDLDISFNYNSLLPSSVDETVNMLAVAVGAGITSVENAVRILTINTPETMGELNKESAAEAKLKAKVAADAAAKAQVEANLKTTASAAENQRNQGGVN
jgi:hypothetical protein